MATKKAPAKKPAAKAAPAKATKGGKGLGKPVVLDESSPSRGGIDLVMSRTGAGGPGKS